MEHATSNLQPTTDEHFMAQAVEAAHAGLGWTSPNPMVGCVIVREGRIIGCGAHLRDGEEHSEVRALADAGDATDATAYVTLEPCTHVGRQPACCDAIIKAGVKRVVYASEDVDPRTAGAAKSILENAGIEVTAGVLKENCDRFLDYYLHASSKQSVFVHLKVAVSMDGKLACKSGHSKWLSCPTGLGYAHYLRQKYDAVLVGSGTVLADNPRLTVRRDTMEPYFMLPDSTPERNPVRIILDRDFHLWKTPHWNFLKTDEDNFRKHLPRVIGFGSMNHIPKTQVNDDPATVLFEGLTEDRNGKLDLDELLGKLWKTGIRSLLVEGGSKVAQEFIRCGMVDKISLVLTPRILGSDALGFSPPLGFETIGDGLEIREQTVEQLDQDVLVSGYLKKLKG